MPFKKKGMTPTAAHSSRTTRTPFEALGIVQHTTRLAPIAMKRLQNCDNLKEMPEDVLKKAKLAHATILKGDVMEGNKNPTIMFGIIVTTDDEVYTWGEDLDGMLGNGKRYGSDHKIPRSRDSRGQQESGDDILHKVEELCGKEVIDVYASHYWSMFFAITKSGDVYSWGLNDSRQLGHSWNRKIVNVPQLIDPIRPAQRIMKVATSDFQTYVLTREGDVYTWGITSNNSQLGQTKVLGPNGKDLKHIVDIVCGCAFVVALDHNGKVYYQKKQVSLKQSTRMEDMNVPGKVVQISTGFEHMLALTDAGKIIGWGKNSKNQLPSKLFPGKEKFSPKLVDGHLKRLQFTKVVAFVDLSVAELKSGGFYIWGQVCMGENQVIREDPFYVRKCSNLEEIFAKYCPCLLPQPLRGDQLPAGEGNGMDSAENVLEENEDNASDSSTCTFVPVVIPTSTSTPKSSRIRKSRSLREKVASELGNSSDSNDSNSPEPTPKKKAKIFARKSIPARAPRAMPPPPSVKRSQNRLQSESESTTTQSPHRHNNSSNNGHNLLAQQSMATSSASLPESTPAAQNRKMGNIVFIVENQVIRPYYTTLKLLRKDYEYFKKELQRNRNENDEITINNISPAAFKAFLGFVDEDEVHLDKDDWANILSLKIFADAKGIDDKELKLKCEQLLDLNADNAQELYFACRKNNLEEGRKLAFEIILKNCKKLQGKGLDLNKFLPFPEDLHELTGVILKFNK